MMPIEMAMAKLYAFGVKRYSNAQSTQSVIIVFENANS